MTIRSILMVIAILLFLIAALLAFGVVTGGTSIIGLVAFGLAFLGAALFPQ